MASLEIPILVGVSQHTQFKESSDLFDPIGLMIKVGEKAVEDTGVSLSGMAAAIDTVCVVNIFCWSYHQAPQRVAHGLGLSPANFVYTAIGGNTPQLLVNHYARSIAAGECRAVLMTGAEAFYALRRMRKNGLENHWPQMAPPEKMSGDNREGTHTLENQYDLFLPSYMYPLFETALRASSGRSVENHERFMANLYEKFSRTAAGNPYAWSREPLTAEQLLHHETNRYIGYPYTMRMNANIDVDQSSAVIMTSEKVAASLGIEKSRWVYPLGGADFNNVWYVSSRPRLDDSPAIAEAAKCALTQAGLSINDINIFDLYSCFPSAVQMAMNALGLPENDPRPLTATGGLAFFGGPGNNYTMHAIAAVVEQIRQNRDTKALVTANGWYNTKQSVGVYGDKPETGTWRTADNSQIQKNIDDQALPEPQEKASGVMKVEAYVIRHDRDDNPHLGTVIGRLQNGRRALAHIRADVGDLLDMEKNELVGTSGTVAYNDRAGYNLVEF
ncbi:MAG: acetyl-CoA acetyltransferase [Smithella sp.]|nr:acetyl-CoA acetyltransferase [Smithella sp.]